MKLTVLQPDQRQFFDDNGYLVVPGALTATEVESLTQISDRMIGQCDRAENQHYVQLRPGIVEEPSFHPLLAHDATLPLVVQLLSPNIHLHTTAIIYKFPESEAAEPSRGWHRDIGMTQDLGHAHIVRGGIKVGYCLTDFHEPQSGFTLFAPGSHKLPTPLPIPEGRIDPENVVDLRLNAGDAFLFENRVYHTSAPNLSERTSKVIILGYSYRWMGGRRDNMEQVWPERSVLEPLDEIRKQLLGGACDGLDTWAQEHDLALEPFQWTMPA